MKQIILWELKQRKMYLFWWSIVTIGLVALLFLIYPPIRNQAEQFDKLLNSLPGAIRDLKTAGGTADVASPVGYLNSQLYYITLPLVQIIMAIGLGGSLLAREEQNHTLELLLARPISRGRLLIAKAVSGILLVLGVAILTALVSIWLGHLTNMGISGARLVLATLYSTAFSLSFGAIAFTLSAIGRLTRGPSVAIAVAISFGGYLLASLSGLSSYIRTPAKLLPYHYYDPAKVLEGHMTTGLNIYLIGVVVLGAAISWLGFRRRDIN